MVTAGVIGVQGDVAEHVAAIKAAAPDNASVDVRAIRESGIVPDCDLLSMPGGESTTISRLIHREGIAAELHEHVAAGKPLLATCAGLIVSARDAKDHRVQSLGIIDISVDRNAFGRQRDSFELELPITGLDRPFPAVFIRAPVIDDVGADVTVLAEYDGHPVAIKDGPVLGTAFHPELTGDPRLHRMAFFDHVHPSP